MMCSRVVTDRRQLHASRPNSERNRSPPEVKEPAKHIVVSCIVDPVPKTAFPSLVGARQDGAGPPFPGGLAMAQLSRKNYWWETLTVMWHRGV
jgi:hypothetical protein